MFGSESSSLFIGCTTLYCTKNINRGQITTANRTLPQGGRNRPGGEFSKTRLRGWSSLHFHRVLILPMARNLIHHGGKTMPHHVLTTAHVIYAPDLHGRRFYLHSQSHLNQPWLGVTKCIPSLGGPPTSRGPRGFSATLSEESCNFLRTLPSNSCSFALAEGDSTNGWRNVGQTKKRHRNR